MSILNSSDLRVKSIIETIRYGFTVFTVHSLFSWISIVVCILNPNYELMMDVREGTHQFEIPISMSLLFDTMSAHFSFVTIPKDFQFELPHCWKKLFMRKKEARFWSLP